MQQDFFKGSERGRPPMYLQYDYQSLCSVNLKISILSYPFKDLIIKNLLFEQFFPTKPGKQVQL